MTYAFQNLNNDLLCAVDVETTGLRPRFHDIIQIAVIPLTTSLEPSPHHIPFICEMKPRRPENIDQEAMNINRMRMCDIMVKGLDPYKAADLFVEWFENLKLSFRKRIIPLGCNYDKFDYNFIVDWLGPETYDMCFHYHTRDIQRTALYLNDRAGWHNEPFPFHKLGLAYLCSRLKVEYPRQHDAVEDARVTAEIYKRMMSHTITLREEDDLK